MRMILSAGSAALLASAALAEVSVDTAQEPDLERLAAADPDLIVVANRSAARKDAVAQVVPAIDMTVDGADLIGDARAEGGAFLARVEAEDARGIINLRHVIDKHLVIFAFREGFTGLEWRMADEA